MNHLLLYSRSRLKNLSMLFPSVSVLLKKADSSSIFFSLGSNCFFFFFFGLRFLLLRDWRLLCDRLWKVLQVTFQWMIIGVDQNVLRLRGRDRVARNHHRQDKFDMVMMVIKVVRRKIKQTASNWDGRWWSAWNVKWWSTEKITRFTAWDLFLFMRVYRYHFVPQSTNNANVASSWKLH